MIVFYLEEPERHYFTRSLSGFQETKSMYFEYAHSDQ